MAKFCQNCGASLEESTAVCPGCGAAQAAPAVYPAPAPVLAPADKVVSTAAFFGLFLLFSLPMVGWIICLVMAFASKNANIRHFARANLLWILVTLIVAVGVGVLLYSVTEVFLEQTAAYIEGNFDADGWSEIDKFFYEIGNQMYA